MNARQSSIPVTKPRRVRHIHTQKIHAAPGAVFPLLCPVREIDWVPGWQPDWVISESGYAEPGCVFQTPVDDSHGSKTATWIITGHDPERMEVEMLKVIPQHTVTRLQISLAPDGQGGTASTILYEYTVLGPAGEQALDECDADWYKEFMHHWEAAMNHYLVTGEITS
jgi:hypothetical protein